jgi:hypothetical protein
MISDRGVTLVAAIGFLALEPRELELQLLHRCFDTWRGIGDVVVGMARQGYDLELRPVQRAWLARDVLPERLRALPDIACGPRVGSKLVGGGAAGSWRCAF